MENTRRNFIRNAGLLGTVGGVALMGASPAFADDPNMPYPYILLSLGWSGGHTYTRTYYYGMPFASDIKGDQITSIKHIQRRLGLSQDGVFGPATSASVKNFQRLNGLQVDGVVGSQTARKMGLKEAQ